LDGINQEKGMAVSGDQQTRERIYVYVLNDDLRLTQPKRAAQPSNEIPLYICREPSTNQLLFMQNKPNFGKAQMNVNIYYINDYQIFIPLAGYKNKPNSNPIKANLRKAKMNVNSITTKDYRKKDDFIVRINKPNFVKGPK